jgi:tRNA(His) 5'-end guanylyltransferase
VAHSSSKIISVIVSFFASSYVMLWPKHIVTAEVWGFVVGSGPR